MVTAAAAGGIVWFATHPGSIYPESPLPLPDAADHISGGFFPSTHSYMAFEPIDISFVVENASNTAFNFPDGGASRSSFGADHNFFVHITGPDGYDVPQFLFHKGGLIGGGCTVPAGGRHERTLLLNSWADLIEPGVYTVTMRRELYGMPSGMAPSHHAPVTTWRLRAPPGLEVAESRLRRLMVQALVTKQETAPPGQLTREEVVEWVDWMLRMPMIESTFEIEILPFEPEGFVEIVAAQLPEEYGPILADGCSSMAIAVICIQLGLETEERSQARALEVLRQGHTPSSRVDIENLIFWVDRKVRSYEAFRVPKPYPIRPEHLAEHPLYN